MGGLYEEYANLEGLLWTVSKETVHDATGDPISGYSRIVRDDDGRTLSVMGADYECVQNDVLFDFASRIPGTDKIAGHVDGGKRVFANIKMDSEFALPGIKGDSVQCRFHLASSHDGTLALIGGMTGIRPC
jgi:hypothetical protein